MKMLVAEDDLTSRTMLSAILRKQGYEVLEAVDGRQALKALKESDAPDVVVMDWMMPGLTGLEVVKKVRSRQAEPPPYIIMLTSRSDKSDIVEALEAGANDYLIKPFDTNELLARIKVGVRMVDLQARLSEKIDELQQALREVKTLRGLLPICSYCKKVRDDNGFWHQVEVYVRKHSEASFTHGMCPECTKRVLAEIENDIAQ